jgi:hypothetical protein
MAVGFGHVHGHRAMAPLEVGAPVASHPLAFVQQLHDVGCEPHIELLFDQRIGYRVVMPLDLNMVIDIDPGRSIVANRLCRDPGNFLQGRVLSVIKSCDMA